MTKIMEICLQINDKLHPTKCMMWCALTAEIIMPYFFEDEHRNAVIATGVCYQTMIEDFLHPRIQNRPKLWFQQDEATAHMARETVQLLKQCFGEKIISRYGNVNWPSHSPDLISPEFVLWGIFQRKSFHQQTSNFTGIEEHQE